MRAERVSMRQAPDAFAADLRELIPPPGSVSHAVAEIIEAVAESGDEALTRFTELFDTAGVPPPPLRVTSPELEHAERSLDGAVREGLRLAYENVHRVAAAGVGPARTTVVLDDSEVTLREEPLGRAAVYVPGGRAPYPSTVIMGVATARAAGVPEVVVCSPPEVNPAILGACRLTGASGVYRMGGAQAIAALAFGTETIPAVDIIVGPGNLYVQEAKRQVSDRVAIDAFAGPSDLLVIVEEDAGDLDAIALDMLAQAEHGEGTFVVGVSTSEGVVDWLMGRIAEENVETGAVVRLVHALTIEDAFELAQALAPEHLQLVGAEAEDLAGAVTRAGCVFVGPAAGTAFGDYIAGSNHVLPTAGSARFASALSAATFRRRFTEVRIEDASALARAAAPVAREEGFELHARSMEARIRDNRP
jgi:histidinol dehydrogenase